MGQVNIPAGIFPNSVTYKPGGGLYLARVIPYGIHMESMESMLAETPANFLFHGHLGFHVE